ncbi:hypothetical protein Q3G72_023685 [Acer saccharum]|nr:hypothetical protein Q3G72_023685 [Acer saccharum]
MSHHFHSLGQLFRGNRHRVLPVVSITLEPVVPRKGQMEPIRRKAGQIRPILQDPLLPDQLRRPILLSF